MMRNPANSPRAGRLPGKPATQFAPRPKIAAPWSLRRVGGVQILELAPIKKLPWLVHGFSTRTRRASTLNSGERVLDLGFTDSDTRENVLKNRNAFQSAIVATDSP